MSHPVEPLSSPQPVRVLIVDADARVRSALRAALDGEPDLHVVGSVSGAPAALDIAVEVAPVVALVDVMVEADASGLTLVHLLSQVPGCRVVAMSVRGAFGAASRVAGAAGFVVKGDDVDTVISAVRAAVVPDR